MATGDQEESTSAEPYQDIQSIWHFVPPEEKDKFEVEIQLGLDYAIQNNECVIIARNKNDHSPLIWNHGWPITFTILRSSFPDPNRQYKQCLKHLLLAIEDWEKVCGVCFKHENQFDNFPLDSEDQILNSVHFIIKYEELNDQNLLAQAFFPYEFPIKKHRKLKINDPFFYNLPVDRSGIFRHELGHILGFRHLKASCNSITNDDGVLPHCKNVLSNMRELCRAEDAQNWEALSLVDREYSRKYYGAPNLPPCSEEETFPAVDQ